MVPRAGTILPFQAVSNRPEISLKIRSFSLETQRKTHFDTLRTVLALQGPIVGDIVGEELMVPPYEAAPCRTES
ncbi:MAG: hypothetical protein INF97_10345 [Roseomonas sp.]|nr:hypothetical protein [Roseomonas sp.]